MTLEAVIFDFDGVISVTAGRQYSWFQQWANMNRCNFQYKDFDHFLEIYNKALNLEPITDLTLNKKRLNAYNKRTKKASSHWSDGVQAFYDLSGLPCDMKADGKDGRPKHPVWEPYLKFLEENPVGLYADMGDAIEEIFEMGSLNSDGDIASRLRIGVNSSNSWKNIAKELSNAGVLKYIDNQVCNEALGKYHGAGDGNSLKKPSKLAVALSLEEASVSCAENMLFIGDTLSDLRACKNIWRPGKTKPESAYFAGVRWGYNPKALEKGYACSSGETILPDRMLDEPADIVELVKELIDK